MAFHYIPVCLIRLIKKVALFTPVLVSVYLFVLLIKTNVEHKRMWEERTAKEKLHLFLERNSVCEKSPESWDQSLGPNVTMFNSTVVEFCRQLEISQKEYFSRRATAVNSFDYTMVKDAKNVCNPDTHMVILVHSLHSYRERRDAIRQTWGKAAQTGDWPTTVDSIMKIFQSRVVFIFGQNIDPKMESNLEEESKTYGDIVQGNFNESYRNMTLKSLLGLKWVLEFCPSVKYLFKCDDDMFINIYAILNLVLESPLTWSIMGPLNRGSRVYRVGKWSLTKTQYPFYYFPPYESGSGYAITADLVRPLLETSKYVPWIFIDDVYVTGILGKILGVNHVTRNGFAYWTSKAPSVCDISKNLVLTGTKVHPQLQLDIWKQLTDRVRCPANDSESANDKDSSRKDHNTS